jgi:formylmethanofuran dehydrogenase subunit B
MSQGSLANTSAPTWTCPFCALLCDSFGLQQCGSSPQFELTGSECAVARAGLAASPSATLKSAATQASTTAVSSHAGPSLRGQACTQAVAVEAAAKLLRGSQQALFAGLSSDVAGARALYRLAHDMGAICDGAGGAELSAATRALQDRGGFSTTLAEVRTRADVIVCVGGSPTRRHPEFFRRCGVVDGHAELGGNGAPALSRQVVFLGAAAADATHLKPSAQIQIQHLPLQGDLFNGLACLAAAVAGTAQGHVAAQMPPALQALAQQLLAARYAVFVWDAQDLPAHAELIIETLGRIVGSLNRSTRAAALALGCDAGASTAQQVFTWLSGLPLRSRAGPLGLEHEPLRFDTRRLLADGAVDCVLWVQSLGHTTAPELLQAASRFRSPLPLPLIVLGSPALAQTLHSAQITPDVFIPVTTPGIGAAGHLFRSDGAVLMPLHAVLNDGLPTVAKVVNDIHQQRQS